MAARWKHWISVAFLVGAVAMLTAACIGRRSPGAYSPVNAQSSAYNRTATLEPLITHIASGENSQFCPILHVPRVMDLQPYPLSQVVEPMAQVSFYDPVFGSCLARISDHESDLVPEDTSRGIRPEGSGVQAFNADSSLILARSSGWFWYVYSARNMQKLFTLPFKSDLEARWDATTPGRLWIWMGTRLLSYDLGTGQSDTVHDFARYFPAKKAVRVGTGHLGSPSSDGRYWPLLAEGEGSLPLALLVYDLVEDRIISRVDLPADARVNGVMLSPRGNYLLAWFEQACPSGETTPWPVNCGVTVYNRQLEDGHMLLPVMGSGDIALDVNGREVLVFHDIRINGISYIDLVTEQVFDLWLIDPLGADLGFNFSGRALSVPGWALVSSFGAAAPGYQSEEATWMDNSVFAMELKQDGRVARLSNTYSADLRGSNNGSWAGPQATVNPDFTRILFSSNWGQAVEGHADIVMIGLPAGWSDLIPE